MRIQVYINDRGYGGYSFQDFQVTAEYDYLLDPDEAIEYIELSKYPYFIEELASILHGQIAPIDITTESGETIIFADETIAKLHIREIAESLAGIDFDDTPWADRIEDLKRRHFERETKDRLASGELNIDVRFLFSGPQQRSGKFSVSALPAGLENS